MELCGNDTGMNLLMQIRKPSQGAKQHRARSLKVGKQECLVAPELINAYKRKTANEKIGSQTILLILGVFSRVPVSTRHDTNIGTRLCKSG